MSGTTYYVSNTGSDANPGTSAAAPWQTAAKVDATAFQPGDTILFQRGGHWRESLTASSDGTAGNPITFGAYGDATAAKPLFLGSDVLDPTIFALVSGTTYSVAHATAVNWVFADGAFTHEAQDALAAAGSTTAADPTTDLNYVEATIGTFYYNATTTNLYVNIGAALTGHTIEAATRDNAVYNNGHSYLAFDSLGASETASDGAGYGFRIQNGSNVTVSNCDDTLAGKHNFGVINTTGFTGENLTASQDAPDSGFGGASAFAFYVDATQGTVNATATFTNCSFTNRGGAYPIMISHGEGPDAIASLTLTDLVSTDGYGGGIVVDATGAAEAVTIHGGDIGGGGVSISTDNALVNGLTVSGQYANVQLLGTGDVVQNCIFSGIDPNEEAGHPAAIVDQGSGSVIRLNTFDWTGNGGSAIEVTSATTNTTIQGNIFAVSIPVDLAFDNSVGAIMSDYNLFQPGTQFQVGSASVNDYVLAAWQNVGYDVHSVTGDADFADGSSGDFSLQPGSPAIDLVAQAPSQSPVTVTSDILGNPRPYGPAFDAGAYEYQHPKPAIVATYAVTAADVPPAVVGTTTTATFTVTLSAPSTTAETVQYTTADGTATAGADYQATSGTLSFPAGVTTRDVRVAVTPTAGNANGTFLLALAHPSVGTEITTFTATVMIPVPPAGVATTVASHSFREYTDGSARTVLIHLAGPGGATVYRSALGGNAMQVVLGGSTTASTLTITTLHGGHTMIGAIDVFGSLGALVAPTVDLAGNLAISGTVGRVTLGNVTGAADLTIGGAKVHPSLSFGAVTNLSITSAAPLAAVSARSWAAPAYGTIAAPSIAALEVSGTFAPDLSLTGPKDDLPAAHIGNVTGGSWAVAGRAGAVAATSTAAPWSATFAGPVALVTIAGDLGGSLTAPSVGTLRVGHNLSAATVTLTAAARRGYDLSSLQVGGVASGSTVRSAGSINAVTLGALDDSTIFAGVTPTVTGLPTTRNDFTSADRLNAFTITGGKVAAGVAAADVAAATVGRIRVTGVQTGNGGTPFGFAVESLAAYTDLEAGKKAYVWTARQGAAALTTSGDYKVTIL